MTGRGAGQPVGEESPSARQALYQPAASPSSIRDNTSRIGPTASAPTHRPAGAMIGGGGRWRLPVLP